MTLLEEWAAWRERRAPYVLEADRRILFREGRSSDAITNIGSWRSAYSADDFCRPGDRKLHLGLLPQPFCGDVPSASIYILGLNPGLGPHDYFGEYKVPKFRRALLSALKQRFSGNHLKFHWLDPQFSWHGGFRWWHGRLAGVIGKLAIQRGLSFAAAREYLSDRLASIELLPYHSTRFHDGGGWLRSLPSVALARAFVSDFVIPRVKSGEAILIATRHAKGWTDLPSHRRVIAYDAGEARAAHLTPESRGGRAILKQLRRMA